MRLNLLFLSNQIVIKRKKDFLFSSMSSYCCMMLLKANKTKFLSKFHSKLKKLSKKMIDVLSRLNWRLSVVKSVESFFIKKFPPVFLYQIGRKQLLKINWAQTFDFHYWISFSCWNSSLKSSNEEIKRHSKKSIILDDNKQSGNNKRLPKPARYQEIFKEGNVIKGK